MATVTDQYVTKSHSSVVLSKLDEQRKYGKLCDITIKVQGMSFRAHRSVLCSCSPYFEAAFNSGMIESKEGVIDLECIDPKAMMRTLNYMYTGAITIAESDIEDTLQAADYLGIAEMRDFCVTFAERLPISVNNCFMLKHMSGKYNLDKLQRKTSSYIQMHFADIVKSREYLTIPLETLMEFLTDDDNIVEIVHSGEIVMGEELLLDVILNWVQFVQDREQHFLTLVSRCVRFHAISKGHLENFIAKSEYLKEQANFCEGFEFLSEQLKLIGGHACDDSATAADPSKPPRRGKLTRVVAVCSATNSIRESKLFYANLLDERRWAALANMPALTFDAAAIKYCDKLYVCGGLVKDGRCSIVRESVYCYDPMLNHWRELPPMLKAVQRHGIAACNGCIYAIGGLEKHVVSSVLQCYDVANNHWTMGAPLPAARCDGLAFTSESYVYIVGGWDASMNNNGAYSNAPPYRYDTRTDTWEKLPNPPFFRIISGRSWVLQTERNKSVLFTDFKGNSTRYYIDSGEWEMVDDTRFKLKLGASARMCCTLDNPSRVLALSSCRSFYIWDSKTGELLERRPPSPQRETDVAITLPYQVGCLMDLPAQFLN